MTGLNVGDKAPNFTLTNAEGKTMSLADFKGKNVILYFYPKDNTPGCTQESCEFNDNLKKFHAQNAVVLGVSRDSEASHQKFKSKYNFKFDLLSDSEEKACSAYDVIKMKNMYGKKVRGIERSTFLIDTEGKIQKIWCKVKVAEHVDEVLKALKSM